MTVGEPPVSPAVTVTAFYNSVPRDELQSGLADISAISLSSLQPLSALSSDDGDGPALVVSNDQPPSSLPDRPLVWVTTDPDVAAAVVDDAAVIHWGLGDDWGMLETRLATELESSQSIDMSADTARAIERIGDAVVALDRSHQVTYINDAAAGLVDAPSAQLLGDRFWDHISDNVASDLRSHVERALSADEQVTAPLELDDGTTLLEVTVYPGPNGVTLRSQDPEDSSMPSLYEYLVETVGDAVYILDTEGRFVFVNDALCEMTGYEREELLGSSVHIIKDDETVDEAEDALRELLKIRATKTAETDAIDIAKLDVELVRKDGTRVPCTDRMTLRPLEDGEFTGTVGTLRDISRQNRRLEILNGLVEQSRKTMTTTGTDAVTDVIVSMATDVFDLDVAALRKYDPEDEQLVPVATSKPTDDILGKRPLYDFDEGPAGTAFTENERVVRENLSGTSDTDVTELDNAVYLPIGNTYVLSLGRSDDEPFDDITLGLLEVFGETAAVAIDRVNREEHLRQYEAIVEVSEDMLFTVDDDRRFTLVTRPFAQLLGYEREALAGRRLDDFLPDEVAEETLAPDNRIVIETEFRGEGGLVPSRLTLAPFEGSFETGWIGTVQDISQLKSAQREASRQRQRFVELFETLSDPVADVSYRDGVARLENINSAFAELCDGESDLLERGPFATALEALPDDLADALAPVRSPAQSLDTTVTAQTPSGERNYLVRTAPYESDGTDRAFILLTDVTELSRRGTQLKVLHRLLRHNLRNETSVIKGHAQQLQQLSLPDEADEHVEKILSAGNELVGASETSQTVQQVLGFDAGDIDPVPAQEALNRLRTDIAGSIAPSSTDIQITVDTDARVPFSRYLLVAIRELVENAVEHEPASAVTVHATDTDNGIRISVADDGDGLPESQWELLTGEQEITQLQHGDGLGLWLVKWVTNRHGGRLRLLEADEDGTTVGIALPDPER